MGRKFVCRSEPVPFFVVVPRTPAVATHVPLRRKLRPRRFQTPGGDANCRGIPGILSMFGGRLARFLPLDRVAGIHEVLHCSYARHAEPIGSSVATVGRASEPDQTFLCVVSASFPRVPKLRALARHDWHMSCLHGSWQPARDLSRHAQFFFMTNVSSGASTVCAPERSRCGRHEASSRTSWSSTAVPASIGPIGHCSGPSRSRPLSER